MAVNDDDSCISADVAERLVMGTRDYVTAVAAHEPELSQSRLRRHRHTAIVRRVYRVVFAPGIGVAGTRG